MARIYETITDQLAGFIAAQPMFFVATAPLAADGHVNLSPKGGDTLRVTGPDTVMYADFAGSGAETIAHLRDNGRITIMWCSFGKRPRIVRIHGRGTALFDGDDAFAGLVGEFPPLSGLRSIISVEVTRIADSCGYAVPRMDLIEPRTRLEDWIEGQTPEELAGYMQENNTTSIDGLPAWPG